MHESELLDFLQGSASEFLGVNRVMEVVVALACSHVEVGAEGEVLHGNEGNGRLHAHRTPQQVLQDWGDKAGRHHVPTDAVDEGKGIVGQPVAALSEQSQLRDSLEARQGGHACLLCGVVLEGCSLHNESNILEGV